MNVQRRQFIAGLGGATAWPLTARAQQRLPRIGLLSGTRDSPAIGLVRQGLGEQGYIEGRNIEILYRWAELRFDRLPSLAADLVGRAVTVIVATGGASSALAAKAATATIPIVFATGADPVALGLVTSLSHPGGNITGVTFLAQTLTAKRVELLHEAIPSATSVALLVNPTNPEAETQIREAETAARALSVRVIVVKATTPSEIEGAFAILAEQQVGGLLTGDDALFGAQGSQLGAMAARHGMPAIFHLRGAVDAGGLISYGADISDSYRLAGVYAGRILNGERPSDLPVQQSTRIKTVLNLKAAKALGLAVPTSILLRAAEVIE